MYAYEWQHYSVYKKEKPAAAPQPNIIYQKIYPWSEYVENNSSQGIKLLAYCPHHGRAKENEQNIQVLSASWILSCDYLVIYFPTGQCFAVARLKRCIKNPQTNSLTSLLWPSAKAADVLALVLLCFLAQAWRYHSRWGPGKNKL